MPSAEVFPLQTKSPAPEAAREMEHTGTVTAFGRHIGRPAFSAAACNFSFFTSNSSCRSSDQS